jgi:hypothetical protein
MQEGTDNKAAPPDPLSSGPHLLLKVPSGATEEKASSSAARGTRTCSKRSLPGGARGTQGGGRREAGQGKGGGCRGRAAALPLAASAVEVPNLCAPGCSGP